MRLRAFLAVAVTALVAPTAGASAAPFPPYELRVAGGDEWRATRGFDLRWTDVPQGGSPVVATRYLVRDLLGAVVVGPHVIEGSRPKIEGIVLPDAPGAYTAEVWFEDLMGAEGMRATATLRFDDTRPGQVSIQNPGDWIGHSELPLAIRLALPAGSPPASGIRGYAVSVDKLTASDPCAAADLCTDTETDLKGGAADNVFLVREDELPDGAFYAHALAVSGSRVRSLTAGHARFLVDKTDPVTRLSGLPDGWTNRAVTLEASAADELSGMAPRSGGGPFTAIKVDSAPPQASPGASTTATVIAPGIHTVSYYARDAAGNVDDGADSNGRANAEPRTATLRIDREPPSVRFIGSASPDEPELIAARVLDDLSGPSPDRGQIELRANDSGDPFQTLSTVAAGQTLLARWHSDEYPVGKYEFRVTGYDAAGNASTASRRANGAPMILPNPLKARTILAAGFGGGHGDSQSGRRLRFGRAITFSGRLTATSDSSLSGRPVRVVERFDPGAAVPRRTAVATTDEEGRFSVRLEPGADREVFAVFDGTAAAAGTTSRPLRLTVASGVRMSVSAHRARIGGRPVVFRGEVGAAAGEVPAGGLEIALQFRAAGLPWTEFRTVRTDRRGRFHHPYRFSDDDSRGVRFRFRALVPKQSEWPYESGSSRPVSVLGA